MLFDTNIIVEKNSTATIGIVIIIKRLIFDSHSIIPFTTFTVNSGTEGLGIGCCPQTVSTITKLNTANTVISSKVAFFLILAPNNNNAVTC